MLLNSHDDRINTFFTSSLVFLLASSWRVFLRLMMHMMIKATKIPNTTTTTAITASFRLLTSENIILSDKKVKSSHKGKNTKFTKEKHCKSKQNVLIIWYCYSVKKKVISRCAKIYLRKVEVLLSHDISAHQWNFPLWLHLICAHQ